jgi:hypothetical protein
MSGASSFKFENSTSFPWGRLGDLGGGGLRLSPPPNAARRYAISPKRREGGDAKRDLKKQADLKWAVATLPGCHCI